MTRPTCWLPPPIPGGLLVLLLVAPVGCGSEEPVPETAPRQVSGSTFDYPEELWDQDIEGQTMLKVFVSATGQVDSAVVEESSGHAAFDSAAVDGAHRLSFEPARRGDDSVGVWVRLPVQFDKANAAADPQDRP